MKTCKFKKCNNKEDCACKGQLKNSKIVHTYNSCHFKNCKQGKKCICFTSEKKIEHCSEPNCPECNIVAYNRGKYDERERIRAKMTEYASKGFELQTALEFCFNEPMAEAIHRNKAKFDTPKKSFFQRLKTLLSNLLP